jgi:type I restriction enzyme, S subunit
LPLHSEQEAIVKKIRRRFSVLDEVEAEVEANPKRTSRLRQAILKRPFEGKLVAQDPADESASELLARIRTKRERSAPPKAAAREATGAGGYECVAAFPVPRHEHLIGV